MSMLKLIWKSSRHSWFRNVLLMLSIAIAYTLFGVLIAFERAYSSAGGISTSRIVTANKISFTQPLPIAYFQAVREVEGIAATSYAAWFGGYYQEPRNRLHTIAVEPHSYLAVYGDDLSLTEDARSTFIRERDSVLVGEAMAARFGWKVGDQVPIVNPRIARSDGAAGWTFRIAGIVQGATAFVDTSFVYIHYDNLNEARLRGQDTIGWIVTAPAPGHDPGQLGQAIDRLFETSADRTTTDSERSFALTFVAQFGDLALATMLILGAAFFSLLVIVSTTTALSIRQRLQQIGILKGLGFSHERIFWLFIGESLVVVVLAGIAGLLAAAALVSSSAESLVAIAPDMAVSPEIAAVGIASLIALAVAASAVPTWRAVNMPAADVLRRG